MIGAAEDRPARRTFRPSGLAPLSDRSRDRLRNSITDPDNPCVPLNRPAIGDLMNLFDFD